jgi:hypothetical protein
MSGMNVLFAVWVLDAADHSIFCVAIEPKSAANIKLVRRCIPARAFTALRHVPTARRLLPDDKHVCFSMTKSFTAPNGSGLILSSEAFACVDHDSGGRRRQRVEKPPRRISSHRL